MYLKIKLLEYNTIIYVKILSITKTRWVVREIPKLNLVNQLTMGTLGKCRDHLIRFNKIKNYIIFGYDLLEIVKDSDIFNINVNTVYG